MSLAAADTDRNSACVEVACPRCEEVSVLRIAPRVQGDSEATALEWVCPLCHRATSDGGALPHPDEHVAQCWVCGCDEFYLQNDFNRRLGVTIVFVSALVIFLVMLLTQDHLLGIYLLLGVALVDWLVYQVLRTVTVCYLCHTIYRGFPRDAKRGGFYLGLEEKYKKLRQDWLQNVLGESAKK